MITPYEKSEYFAYILGENGGIVSSFEDKSKKKNQRFEAEKALSRWQYGLLWKKFTLVFCDEPMKRN